MNELPTGNSRAAADKQAHADRIAAVNHWRGQCLDNFARAEHAIIRFCETLVRDFDPGLFEISEAARNRTKTLREALTKYWPKDPSAKRVAALLDHWSIRETERNELVHGRFSVKVTPDRRWLLINEIVVVRKGVVHSERKTFDDLQAEAFLKAVAVERKRLEKEFGELSGRLDANPCTTHRAARRSAP